MPRPIRNANGAAIRELRRANGLKMYELADAVRITDGYLSSIERGHCDASPWVLNRIAAKLGVPRAAVAASVANVPLKTAA